MYRALLAEDNFQTMRNFQEAVQAFQEAISINPQLGTAREELGYCSYRLGRYEEAVESLRKALYSGPNFTPNYYLGLVYIELKNLDYAQYYLLAATSQAPSGRLLTDSEVDAFYRLGLVLKQNGELESNILAKETAIKESESLKKTKTADGREVLERMRFELANLYLWAGRVGAAKEQYRQLKASNLALASALRKLIILHGAGMVGSK
jgi:tetratricopeptide (TPR) repeat protein